MPFRPPRALLGFLKPYDRAIRDLALDVRAFVLADMTPCYEYIYDAYNAVALGYGPTDRYQDGVCHIAVYATHVNLGFNQGATLDDPKGLLQGTGKAVRHITITAASDLERPELRACLRCACTQARFRGLPGARKNVVISVVKAISAKKRRPGARRDSA
jgi:Domain of unknown function (DU1801)